MNARGGMRESNQEGFAAIVMAIVLVIVLSLITVGFAELMRHEERSALDRQLSGQAYYAAESAINDAQHIISKNKKVEDKTECKTGAAAGDITQYKALNPVLGSDVSYTCLLVKGSAGLNQLVYPVSDVSTVIPIHPSGAGATFNLHLSWPSLNGGTADATNCPNNVDLPAATSWTCPFPLLRIDLVPTDGLLTRNGLAASTETWFFKPAASGSGVTYGGPKTPQLVTCSTTCDVTLNLSTRQYEMRALLMYNDSLSVNLTIDSDPGVSFGDAQIIIDATGKAQDVLRRVQVRIPPPAGPGALVTPDYAVQVRDSLCKRFTISSSSPTIAPDLESSVNAGGNGNPFCGP